MVNPKPISIYPMVIFTVFPQTSISRTAQCMQLHHPLTACSPMLTCRQAPSRRGTPSAAVRKIAATSPTFEEILGGFQLVIARGHLSGCVCVRVCVLMMSMLIAHVFTHVFYIYWNIYIYSFLYLCIYSFIYYLFLCL